MEGDLNLDALLTDDQIAELGLGENGNNEGANEGKPKNELVDTEDLTIEDLFGEGNASPEKVGNEGVTENELKEEKKPESNQTKATSPDNLYSSIAEAMVDDGFFSDFKDDVKNCKSASDLLELVEKHVNSRLDETQKRIDEALNNGVEPSVVAKTERTLKFLEGITNDTIEDESDSSVKLRQQLIYNDYLSKGFSQKKAAELVKRSFDDGTDIDDAKEALESYTSSVRKNYNSLLDNARNEKKKIEEENNQRKDELKKMILDNKDTFGEELNQNTRQKIYDVATKAYRKDKESGDYMTELEIYEQEHPVDFLANVAYYFAITDGFKNKKTLTDAAEKKATKAGLKKLEQVINGTQRNSDGSLRLVGGRQNETYLDDGEFIDL